MQLTRRALRVSRDRVQLPVVQTSDSGGTYWFSSTILVEVWRLDKLPFTSGCPSSRI